MNLKIAILFAYAFTCVSTSNLIAGMVGLGVGNSVTGTFIQLNRLNNLSAGEGTNSLQFEYHIRSNSSLSSFVDSPSLATDFTSALGTYRDASANHKLDFLMLQPFYGRTIREEVNASAAIIQQLRNNPDNANTRILIYQAWPVIQTGRSYLDAWNQGGVNLDSSFEPSKEAFRLFDQELNSKNIAFDIVPVGNVMAELAMQLESGMSVPGLSSANDLYGDSIHLNNNGAYIASLTAYSVLYGKSPVGLPHSADFTNVNYGTPLDPNAVPYVQQLVGNVVGVPEPASWMLALLGIGLAGSNVFRRNKSRKKPLNDQQ